VRKA
jgi:small subunit ribosomal protein S13